MPGARVCDFSVMGALQRPKQVISCAAVVLMRHTPGWAGTSSKHDRPWVTSDLVCNETVPAIYSKKLKNTAAVCREVEGNRRNSSLQAVCGTTYLDRAYYNTGFIWPRAGYTYRGRGPGIQKTGISKYPQHPTTAKDGNADMNGSPLPLRLEREPAVT